MSQNVHTSAAVKGAVHQNGGSSSPGGRGGVSCQQIQRWSYKSSTHTVTV